LTPKQVDDVLTKTASDRLHSYIVVSLLTGGRTEELRALRWEHVHLEADGAVPPHVEVWRSVRVGGDTKTRKSRRTLALPERCIQVLAQTASTAGCRPLVGRRTVARDRTGVQHLGRN
jgi:integrase